MKSKIRIYTEDQVSAILRAVMDSTYVCSLCGRVIFPKAVMLHDGKIEIQSSQGEIRGGFGNKTMKDHICGDCYKKIGQIE